MRGWLQMVLAAALFSCSRPSLVGRRTPTVDLHKQKIPSSGSRVSFWESSRNVRTECNTPAIWVHRLRGGQDEDAEATNQRWMQLDRVYGPFCNFPEEGTSMKLEENFQTHSGDDEDDDMEEDEEDFVLHLPTCDAFSEVGECPEHEVDAAAAAPPAAAEDVSSFYGVAPQWSTRLPAEGEQRAEEVARRRLRRAAFDSMVIPWNITEAALDASLPAMLRQLRVIDPSISKEDLAAALFKFRLLRDQVAHVKELGITHGWNYTHPPATSVTHLSHPLPELEPQVQVMEPLE